MKAPTRKKCNDNIDEDEDLREKEAENQYHIDLAKEVEQVMSDICEWKVDDYKVHTNSSADVILWNT